MQIYCLCVYIYADLSLLRADGLRLLMGAGLAMIFGDLILAWLSLVGNILFAYCMCYMYMCRYRFKCTRSTYYPVCMLYAVYTATI